MSLNPLSHNFSIIDFAITNQTIARTTHSAYRGVTEKSSHDAETLTIYI